MGLAVQQLHNLVRTYQRVLQADSPAQTSEAAFAHQEDSVSISSEARERVDEALATEAFASGEKGRQV